MFRQITSIAGPHFGEIRNIKPPLSGPKIVNSIIGIRKHTDKLEFVEFPVIASQFSNWRGNLLDRRTISRG